MSVAAELVAAERVRPMIASASSVGFVRSNILWAGLDGFVDLRVGPALDASPEALERDAAFDLIFIDADKENSPCLLRLGV